MLTYNTAYTYVFLYISQTQKQTVEYVDNF